MHGAVIGGGLELAAAAHIRLAERNAYYALTEGTLEKLTSPNAICVPKIQNVRGPLSNPVRVS